MITIMYIPVMPMVSWFVLSNATTAVKKVPAPMVALQHTSSKVAATDGHNQVTEIAGDWTDTVSA